MNIPRRRIFKTTTQTSRFASSLFAALIPGDRHHEFSGNDGTLEAALRIAGHADSRTTKLYHRRGQKILLEDMEDSILKKPKGLYRCIPFPTHSPFRAIDNPVPKDSYSGEKLKVFTNRAAFSSHWLEANQRQNLHQLSSR